jgi:hypothetical protein
VAGQDEFTFVVNDGEFNSNTAKIIVTINPLNELFKINGTITYNGYSEGMLIVDAFAKSDLARYTPIGIGASSDWNGYTNVEYEVFVPKGVYKVAAFIDTNKSSEWEKAEPFGKYHEPVIMEDGDDNNKRDFALCIKGDIDGDGEITPQDAVDTFWLSFKEVWKVNQLCPADYDEDFEITPQDAVDIFKASF